MRKARREEGGKLSGSESQLGAGGWRRNPADSGLSRSISGCGAGSKCGGPRNLDTRDSQRIRRQHPALPASHKHIPPQPTGLAPCALRPTRPPPGTSSDSTQPGLRGARAPEAGKGREAPQRAQFPGGTFLRPHRVPFVPRPGGESLRSAQASQRRGRW